MKNLAPEITRQRLLIEGFFGNDVDEDCIRRYFSKITEKLQLRQYSDPIIFSPKCLGKGENQGFDAFVPLIDSGISLYVWSEARFISIIIYTCKNFDEERAVEVTKEYFKIDKIEYQNF